MEQYDSISTKRNVYNAQSLTYSTKNLCFYKKKSLSKNSWSISTFFNDKYRLTFAYLKNQDEFFCTNKTYYTVSVSNGRIILFWVKTSFIWNVLSLGIIFVLS